MSRLGPTTLDQRAGGACLVEQLWPALHRVAALRVREDGQELEHAEPFERGAQEASRRRRDQLDEQEAPRQRAAKQFAVGCRENELRMHLGGKVCLELDFESGQGADQIDAPIGSRERGRRIPP